MSARQIPAREREGKLIVSLLQHNGCNIWYSVRAGQVVVFTLCGCNSIAI